MTVTVTCEECGRRHRLARLFHNPAEIHLICHTCEMPLTARLTGDALANTEPQWMRAGRQMWGAQP